uniref:TCF3 (E2A) fusion partner n=1 Tax=Cyprinus carpio TaxID=7962 RepID=A0A8C2FAP9_CYPCA
IYNKQSESCMVMEDFSGLALPPLFGGHFLEAELETGGVELGPSGTELLDSDGAPSGPAQDEEDESRELDHSKYHALSKRCREIEQVNEKILGRLHQVQRLTLITVTCAADDSFFYCFKKYFIPKMKNSCKCAHPWPIPDLDKCVSLSYLEKCVISSMDALQ